MPRVEFGLYELSISFKMDSYRRLLDSVNQQMDKDLTDLGLEAERAGQAEEGDDSQIDYRDYLSEEYLEREMLKGIFLHSFFASSFALFEHELVRICERARRDAKSPFSVKDFGGARRYEKC